jgi:hypothetical protein
MKKNVASTPPNSLDPNFCKVHKQPFTLYCEIDAIIICDKCKNSHNNGHKLHDLGSALPLIIKKNIQLRL